MAKIAYQHYSVAVNNSPAYCPCGCRLTVKQVRLPGTFLCPKCYSTVDYVASVEAVTGEPT